MENVKLGDLQKIYEQTMEKREKARQYAREYRKTHREEGKVYMREYRARKRTGSIEPPTS